MTWSRGHNNGFQSHVGRVIRYSQVCQGLESSKGILGECPDVIVLDEAGDNQNPPQLLPLRVVEDPAPESS